MTQKMENYLKRYADRYQLARADDGIWQIRTTHRPRDGMAFDVYLYSDTHLAVLLPPKAARNLFRHYPGTFTIHQDASDGVVLVFAEAMLDELADDLKIRRKRQVSDAELKRLADLSLRFSPFRRVVECKRPFSEREKVG